MATQTILFYLHSIDPIALSFIELDEQNHIIKTQLRADLSKFIPHDAKKIIVVVPALEILVTHVELPKLTRKRLWQAIPFAVEEQLIDEVSRLHFCAGEYIPDNHWPIAVVNKEKMRQWIELLDGLKIHPNQIIPATLAIPFTEGRWTVYCLDNLCFVRTKIYDGFSCEPTNLAVYLESKLAEETHKPAQIDIYSEEKIMTSLSSNCPVIHLKATEQKLIESLGYAINKRPTLNLLQGAFRTNRKSVEAKKFWSYAGYLTLAWLAIGFVSNVFSLLALLHRESTINQQISAIYQHNFPGGEPGASPKTSLEEKLKKLTSQASNESFLVLLANVGNAYSQSGGVRLQSLNYVDKQFLLDISTSNFDELDAFTHALQQNQLNVKQQHAEMIAGRIKAALQVSGEAS
jgi:general secretion pathway protein L